MDLFISLFTDDAAKSVAYFIIIISLTCIIFIVASYYYDYQNKINILKRLDSYERSHKDLVEEFRSFELLISDQKRQIDEYKFVLNNIEQEIARLADSLNSDKNITMAISLAKEGLSVSDISNKTGIPHEEVEPIVKYHGNKES